MTKVNVTINPMSLSVSSVEATLLFSKSVYVHNLRRSGYTHDEIAKSLGLYVSTVKVLLGES